MLVTSVCTIFIFLSVSTFPDGGLTRHVMPAVRTDQKPVEDICPRPAIPDVTLCENLNPVEAFRINESRTEIFDPTVFPFIQSIPQAADDGIMAETGKLVFFF